MAVSSKKWNMYASNVRFLTQGRPQVLCWPAHRTRGRAAGAEAPKIKHHWQSVLKVVWFLDLGASGAMGDMLSLSRHAVIRIVIFAFLEGCSLRSNQVGLSSKAGIGILIGGSRRAGNGGGPCY
jgi:hypothetical protein